MERDTSDSGFDLLLPSIDAFMLPAGRMGDSLQASMSHVDSPMSVRFLALTQEAEED